MNAADRQAADVVGGARRPRSWVWQRLPLPIRALLYYVVFLAFILAAVPYAFHLLGARLLPWQVELGWGRGAGWLILIVCWMLYTLWSFLLMQRGRGAYVEFDPPTKFVATGPFRWCRNPIALSLLGMVLGLALAFSSPGVALLFLVGILFAHLQVVMVEEPRLKRRFGQDYVSYCERVPRWIPRPPRRAER